MSAPTNGRALAGDGASRHLHQSYTRCDRRHMLSAWHHVDFLVALAVRRQGAPSGGGTRFHKDFDWGDREIEIREGHREKRYWGIAEGW